MSYFISSEVSSSVAVMMKVEITEEKHTTSSFKKIKASKTNLSVFYGSYAAHVKIL